MRVCSLAEPSLLGWCPVRDESRLFARATPRSVTQAPHLDICEIDFLAQTPQIKTVHTFNADSPFTVLDWAVHPAKATGIIAAGHENGSIDVIIPSEKKSIPLGDQNQSGAPISCLAFNPTQNNVLLAVSEKDIGVWDLKAADRGKPFTTGTLSRSITGTVTGVAWHNSPTLPSIFGFCDSNGQVMVWDLRSARSTHSFTDTSFRAKLSDIKFAPQNKMTVATASGDARNAIVYLWDLRSTGQPTRKLHGHTAAINRLEWPAADERLLLSAGDDGNVIVWNVETGEQLNAIAESGSQMTDLAWSPFIHGALLTSTNAATHLYSLADPSAGAKTRLANPAFHQRTCGMDVAFDGKIFQFYDDKVKSFEYKEDIAESGDFMSFVEALEGRNLDEFVEEKVMATEDETEKKLWEITKMAMNPATFKESLLTSFDIVPATSAEQLLPVKKPDARKEESGASSAALFGDAPVDTVGEFGADSMEEAEVFGEVFTPFRVLPKQKDDEQGNIIAKAMVAGNIQVAVDCAFNAERYAEALIIASCGGPELFMSAKSRYIRHVNSPLSKLVSHISENKLDSFVRYAKTKDWKEIFAVICNYAHDSFEQLCDELGRRLMLEKNDYEAALYCFVAAKKYDMVQHCLFNLYEKDQKDTSSAEVILLVMEKLCAMAGDKAGSVIGEIARSFLQHVIQSGHKDDAIRFVNAVPDNRQLLELKNALTGVAPVQRQPQQSQQGQYVPKPQPPVQQQTQVASQPARMPQTEPRPSNIFRPLEGPMISQEKQIPPPMRTTSAQAPYSGPQMPNFGPRAGTPEYMPINAPPTMARPAVGPPPSVSRPAIQPPPMGPTVMPQAQPQAPPTNMFVPAPSPYMTPQPAAPVIQAPPPQAPPVVKQPPPTPTIIAPPSVIAPTVGGLLAATASMPVAPPPMAAPQINAPPPMAVIRTPQIVTPPMGMGLGMPPQQYHSQPMGMPSAPVPASPTQAPAPKSPEATIDEVPDENRQLAETIVSLLQSIEARPDLSVPAKKAFQDAKSKMPYVFAAFRDGTVEPDIIQSLTLFIQKLNASDITSATQIRKKCTMTHMSKCRDVVLLMSYIQNAMR